MAYIVIIGVWLGGVLQRAQFFDPVVAPHLQVAGK